MAENQFVTDMEEAGYEVFPYAGRYFWKGPAVRCTSEAYQDVIRATKVRVQSESLGRGFVVYPVSGDEAWYKKAEKELYD